MGVAGLAFVSGGGTLGGHVPRRVIQDSIEDRLSEMLLAGHSGARETVKIDRLPEEDGGGLRIEPVRKPAPMA